MKNLHLVELVTIVLVAMALAGLVWAGFDVRNENREKMAVRWADDLPHPKPYVHNYFVLLSPDGNQRFELGLRGDGVVVWRELKP